MLGKTLTTAAAGNAGAGEATYVEDVFSTYLYEGNSLETTIVNGIPLSTDNSIGSSVYFHDHYNSIITGSSVQAGTGNFTIEFFYKEADNTTAYAVFFEIVANTTGQRIAIQKAASSSPNSMIYVENSSVRFTTSATDAFDGDWHHHAIVRNGNTVTYYVDGTSVGTYTTSFNNSQGDRIFVGDFSGNIGGYALEGYLSNLRYVVGTAVYTSSFTPPTEDLTAVTGTEVLLYQGDNPLSDNSGNSYTLSGTSPLSRPGFGPFPPDFDEAKGGLVWLKNRDYGDRHALFDTERGVTERLSSNLDNAEFTDVNSLLSFNANGFTFGSSAVGNRDARSHVSWTFAKQEKFFDVVTYTGTGSTQNISHNLGSTPGFIIIKRRYSSGDWVCYHRSLTGTKYLKLNSNNAAFEFSGYWNNTDPTDSVFTVGNHQYVNAAGGKYVAYLFAHNDDDGGFGEDGDQDIIKCGSYTGNGGSTGPTINLGFEPQWLLLKHTGATYPWVMVDSMRDFGQPHPTIGLFDLNAASDASESEGRSFGSTSTGFQIVDNHSEVNHTGQKYIYVAIRRGPMKTPTDATEVFKASIETASLTPSNPKTGILEGTDLWINTVRSGSSYFLDRIRGWAWVTSNLTTSENTSYNWKQEDATTISPNNNTWYSASQSQVDYFFRRAPKFFDTVCYKGNGTSDREIPHNLGVTPELWIQKQSSASGNWGVVTNQDDDANFDLGYLNTGGYFSEAITWTDPALTATNIHIQNSGSLWNQTNVRYVAWLFATLEGISKVGTYTGTGAAQTIDCGFANGARFVMIKKIPGTSDWHFFDTARGIVAGNDPRLEFNTNDTEDTAGDYVDPESSGFAVTSNSNVNANGSTYLFLAIA